MKELLNFSNYPNSWWVRHKHGSADVLLPSYQNGHTHGSENYLLWSAVKCVHLVWKEQHPLWSAVNCVHLVWKNNIRFDQFLSLQDACFGSAGHLAPILIATWPHFNWFPMPPNLQNHQKRNRKQTLLLVYTCLLRIEKFAFVCLFGPPKPSKIEPETTPGAPKWPQDAIKIDALIPHIAA